MAEKKLKKRKFIVIKECIHFKPDFDRPRYLKPDGGKTIYELREDAPRHVFKPVDPDPGPTVEDVQIDSVALTEKTRQELEDIATGYGVPNASKAPNKAELVNAIIFFAERQEDSDKLPADENPKTEGEGSPKKKADA